MLEFAKGEKKMVNLVQDVPEANMVILMRPLFVVGQWFGVFPLQLKVEDPEHALYQDKTSFNFIRSIFIFFITTSYILFHIFSIAYSILKGEKLVNIIGQSLWLQSSIVSYIVSISLIFNPKSMINLFIKDWRTVETDCGQNFSGQKVRHFTRNCCLLYFFLSAASAVLVTLHSIYQPTYPAYFLKYVQIYYAYSQNESTTYLEENNDTMSRSEFVFDPGVLALQACVQFFFMIWKWAGGALLDVSLGVFGYVVSQTIDASLSQVNKASELGLPNPLNANRHQSSKSGTPSINQVSEATANTISKEALVSMGIFGDMTSKKIGNENDNGVDSPNALVILKNNSDLMMCAIEQIQKLAQLVQDVNRAVGPLLLVDFGQLILMICLLICLPIKYGNDFDWTSALLFSGNALVFVTRLVLLTILLGDVYPTGVEANTKIAKYITIQRRGLSHEVFNPILGHLSVFSANPICFNAWGFFPITRGTLLGTLSVISTYIVVFLQMK